MGNLGETMAQNEKNEDDAKKMYMDGTTDPYEIASQLGCPVQHVLNWIDRGNWDGNSKEAVNKKGSSSGSSKKFVYVIVIIVIAYLIFKIFISKTITF